MTQSVASFAIQSDGEGYRMEFTLDDGETVSVLASFEQLDDLAEEIDRRLDEDQP